MQLQKQSSLKLITNKHLRDIRSDQLYNPFRDITLRVQPLKYAMNREKFQQFQKISQQSLLPEKLEGLEISNEPINPLKKFKKIAQRQKKYEPVQQEVFRKLLEQNREPQKTVYKYTDLTPKQNGLKSVPVMKIAENRLNLGDKLNVKLQLIVKPNQKEQSYNLFSFLDEPLHHLRKKL